MNVEGHIDTGLALFRQLVTDNDNALRTMDVFACAGEAHEEGCECFWEQCEAWAKADSAQLQGLEPLE